MTDKDTILDIVAAEVIILLNYTDDLSGFCKFLAHQIRVSLTEANIKSWVVDLNAIVGVDHMVLISEYQEENKHKYILIDPTFIQFKKNRGAKLLKLKAWPSDKLPSAYVNELLKTGTLDIDNTIFNAYLNAFTEEKISLNINEYLTNKHK